MSRQYPPRQSDRTHSSTWNQHGGFGRGGRGSSAAGRNQVGSIVPQDGKVVTNLFRVEYTGDPSEPEHQWHQYRLTVTPLKGLIKFEQAQENTWKELPNADATKIDRMRGSLAENGSTELSRALFRALSDQVWENHGVVLATDSAQMGIANKKIPLDENDGNFLIKVDNRGFRVRVELTTKIAMGIFTSLPSNQDQLVTAEVAKQCLEIIFKYGLGRSCLSCDTNPQNFFLPEDLQRGLAQQDLRDAPLRSYWTSSGHMPIAPFEGITQSARYTNMGEFVMVINNKVDWLYRDTSTSGDSIPILDKNQSTIAGVKIRSLDSKLSNDDLEKVESALATMKLKVLYKKGVEWERGRRVFLEAKGKDAAYIDAFIMKHRTFEIVHSMMIGKKEGTVRSERIKDSCAAETFEKDLVEIDVEEYFKKIYDIKIEYPHLPVVSVGGRGFFPVEFLYQEQTRVGGKEKHRQEEVLKYHDYFSGHRRVKRLQKLKEYAYGIKVGSFETLDVLLQEFQIKIDNDPMESPAELLQGPSPQFRHGKATLVQGSGSWNLAKQVFANAADLFMPVILDFTESAGLPIEEMIGALFESMKGHGMRVCSDMSHSCPGWIDLIFKYPRGPFTFDRDKVREARINMLRGGSPLFSCVVGPDGDVENTWILKEGDKWIRIPPAVMQPCEGDAGESHLIRSRRNPEQTAKARIQFCVDGIWKDPSDTKGDEVIQRWDRFQIWIDDRWLTIDENEIADTQAFSVLNDWQIECPSMVFCYISDVDTPLYNLLKTVCDMSVGLNSQIIVKATASRQTRSTRTRLPQYCSNVALKVNTKLFNRGNRAVAWTIPTKWYHDRPTIILGYSVANGRVHGVTSTALAGSVCLFHPMQMGQAVKLFKVVTRRDVVDSLALKHLISDLVLNHYAHTRQMPLRILVYRDGGSRGSMETIKAEEVKVVREGFKAVFPGADEPTLTFLVSNTDHNINIVPSTWSDDSKLRNVPSGTTVSVVEEFRMNNNEPMGEFSFLLTAQGGLKGTSKPMLYTCLVNENLSSGLDKAKLKSLTYDLSFQYGSATKSPRKVPVLLNSEKLANRALNYALYFAMAGVDVGQSTTSEHHFDRSDEMGSNILGGLYPSFGVRDSRCRRESDSYPARHWRAPFRAHITG